MHAVWSEGLARLRSRHVRLGVGLVDVRGAAGVRPEAMAVTRRPVPLDSLTVRAYPRRVPLKPGWKTTEFWTTVFVALIHIGNTLGLWDAMSRWHSGILVTIAVAAYAASRGLAKRQG